MTIYLIRLCIYVGVKPLWLMLQISVLFTFFIYIIKSDIFEGVWFICTEYEYRGDFYSFSNVDCFFFIWNILDATKYDAWKSYRYRKGLQKGTQSNRYTKFHLEVRKRASLYKKGTQKVHFCTFLFYLIFNSENLPEKGTLFFLRYQKAAKKVPKERYRNYEKGTKCNGVVEVLIRNRKGTGDKWLSNTITWAQF